MAYLWESVLTFVRIFTLSCLLGAGQVDLAAEKKHVRLWGVCKVVLPAMSHMQAKLAPL